MFLCSSGGAALLFEVMLNNLQQFLQISGLPSHPQHELIKRQCTGCPGMITFYIKGNLEHATAFLNNLKVNDSKYTLP